MTIRRLMWAADFTLMAIAAASCVALFHPLLMADPMVGECTNECQNRRFFYANAGGGIWFKFDCEDCTGCVNGQCAWVANAGPSCNRVPATTNAYYECESGTLVCQISGNFVFAEAKDLIGCQKVNDYPADVCGPAPGPITP